MTNHIIYLVIKDIIRLAIAGAACLFVTFMLIVLLVSILASHAHAGTCVNRQDGSAAVQTCSNGSVTVYHSSGRVEQYGHRNGGFDRYPGAYYPARRMRGGE